MRPAPSTGQTINKHPSPWSCFQKADPTATQFIYVVCVPLPSPPSCHLRACLGQYPNSLEYLYHMHTHRHSGAPPPPPPSQETWRRPLVARQLASSTQRTVCWKSRQGKARQASSWEREPTMAVQDTGPEQTTTTTVLLVLATIFVALRFWARWNVAARYGIDDWLIVAGLVSTCLACPLSSLSSLPSLPSLPNNNGCLFAFLWTEAHETNITFRSPSSSPVVLTMAVSRHPQLHHQVHPSLPSLLVRAFGLLSRLLSAS